MEPRGFEPLTSAVQKRIHTVVVVRCCSEIPANKHILSCGPLWMFVVVRLGCCTVAARGPHPKRGTYATCISFLLHNVLLTTPIRVRNDPLPRSYWIEFQIAELGFSRIRTLGNRMKIEALCKHHT